MRPTPRAGGPARHDGPSRRAVLPALGAVAAVAAVGLVGCRGRAAGGADPADPADPAELPEDRATGRATSSGGSRRPTRLQLPAIGLDEPVRALGLAQGGDISPPSGVVQWYTGSVPPGATGIAVIAGHVSSPELDVFHGLSGLAVGDGVRVTDTTGVRRGFVVERTARVGKQELTRDPSVWGRSERPVLVLVTCDDDSAVEQGRYSGNLVVWCRAA